MEDKHLEMLGRRLFTIFDGDRLNKLTDIEAGSIIYIYVKYLELEAQRDARDKAKGKGE